MATIEKKKTAGWQTWRLLTRISHGQSPVAVDSPMALST